MRRESTVHLCQVAAPVVVGYGLKNLCQAAAVMAAVGSGWIRYARAVVAVATRKSMHEL